MTKVYARKIQTLKKNSTKVSANRINFVLPHCLIATSDATKSLGDCFDMSLTCLVFSNRSDVIDRSNCIQDLS